MNKSKFLSLAQAFGSDLSRWPEDQRHLAFQALESNPGWHEILNAELALDQELDQYQLNIDVSQLETLILQQTTGKTGTIDKLLAWLIPSGSLLRPALVACIPILVGVIIGSNLDLELDEPYLLTEELQYIQFDNTYTSESQNAGGYN